MSNQEAIALLRNLEDSLDAYCELNEEGKTAFRMAIEALSYSEFPNSSDTISRQQAIDALRAMQTYKLFAGDDMLLIDQAGAQTELMMLPPAQPERIKGHWIESNGLNILMKKFIEKGETWRVCDKCGAGFMIGYQYECDKLYHETFHNFCPKCGAEMEVTE